MANVRRRVKKPFHIRINSNKDLKRVMSWERGITSLGNWRRRTVQAPKNIPSDLRLTLPQSLQRNHLQSSLEVASVPEPSWKGYRSTESNTS